MRPKLKKDRDALIPGFKEDLVHEYQALLICNSCAAMASSIHRAFLRGI